MRFWLALPLLVVGALAAGEGEPVAVTAPPILSFSCGPGAMWSLGPDRPSEAKDVRIRYEAVRLECAQLTYLLAALPGIKRPVLSTAQFIGGPDGRVLLDTSASQLTQVSFRGIMRPRRLDARRLDPDPTHPAEVRFRIEVTDLGDIDGVMARASGSNRYVAWADRAVLEIVATQSATASSGLEAPRLDTIHFYGQGETGRPATVLRLPTGAPPQPSQVEALQAAHAYEALVSDHKVISLYFDDAGIFQTMTGGEIFEGSFDVSMQPSSRPVLTK